MPRPFLKWVGGKGQLLDELLARIESAGPFKRYHEPFVGGGALFFELYRRGDLPRAQTYLSDTNPNLLVAYEGIKQDVDAVIARLLEHKAQHSSDYYYEVRAEVPEGLIDRAARIVYLNKTCFNGLYRENSRGLFNVPIGKYKNPLICDDENLHGVAKALSRAKIERRSFDTVLQKAKADDLVYFDPPYDPVSKTSSFTDYAAGGFGVAEQEQLAEVFAKLTEKGVRAMLSNSDTARIRRLYAAFTIDEVKARRAVNSNPQRRGAITELLVRNF